MQKLESILGEHYCFKGLDKAYLYMIVEKAEEVTFE